jgi:hypothetical protein
MNIFTQRRHNSVVTIIMRLCLSSRLITHNYLQHFTTTQIAKVLSTVFSFLFLLNFSYSFHSTIFRTGSGLSGEECSSPGSNSGPLGRRVEMIARLEEFSSMELLALLATSSVIGSL